MYEIIQEDEKALIFLNNLGNSTFDQFWILVSDKFIWIPLYVIFLYLLRTQYSWRNVFYILLFIAIGLTISDQLAGIFKHGIQRLRPCHDPDISSHLRYLGCGGKYGFYSSHASNAFFIATFLSILIRTKYRYLPYFLFLWAALVSYSRIYLGVHFPLDVSMGGIMGFLLGGLFASLSLKVINTKNKLL